MTLHMNDQRIALTERLGAQTALKFFQVEVDSLVVLQDLRVEETLPTTLKFALVRPLPSVPDHVALQSVFVGTSLSTFWTNHLLVLIMSSHLVT